MKLWHLAAGLLPPIVTIPAAQAQSQICRGEASGPNWRTQFTAVIRDAKLNSIRQYTSGSGVAKAVELGEFAAGGTGPKLGWLRVELSQGPSGQAPAMTLFAPAMAADEMAASYKIRLSAGGNVLAEVQASEGGFEAGWPVGTPRALSARITGPAALSPILKALDSADSATVETVAVLLDKSTSVVARFSVTAESVRQSRAAAASAKAQSEAAMRAGTCAKP